MTYQQAVEQVREGKAQLHYDNGDLEGLGKFIKEAFPGSGEATGCALFYYSNWGTWLGTKHPNSRSVVIKLSEIMEIKTTKERIQSAYDKAGEEGETVIKELFPEHIKEDKSVDVRGDMLDFIWKNNTGLYHANKSFWLSEDYNWEVKSVEDGVLLIPTKK